MSLCILFNQWADTSRKKRTKYPRPDLALMNRIRREDEELLVLIPCFVKVMENAVKAN